MGVEMVHVYKSNYAENKRDDLPDIKGSKEKEEHQRESREPIWSH
jgi:hypothetical protein